MDKYEKRLKQLFHGICVVSAISLTCYCISEYKLNADLVQILYKEFHESIDDIYPSITFCLNHPFVEEKLLKYNSNLKIPFYKDILSGAACRQAGLFKSKWYREKILQQGIVDMESEWCFTDKSKLLKWNQSWTDIDYDEVTFKLQDFLLNFLISFKSSRKGQDVARYVMNNNSMRLQEGSATEEYRRLEKLNYYVSARQPDYKCFSFDIPFVKGKPINKVELTMTADALPDKIIRPKALDYFVTLGYPNQIIRSLDRNKVFIRPQIDPTQCYVLDTIVGSMEVLKRRDKRDGPCITDWQNYDKHVLEAISKKAGCIPKHWKVDSDMANCTTSQQYRTIYREYDKIRGSVPPCRGIEQLVQTSFETDFGIKCTFFGSWRLMITMDFHRETGYKEVLLVRALSFQSLVGNSGKYIAY
jgi:hypothetical protein